MTLQELIAAITDGSITLADIADMLRAGTLVYRAPVKRGRPVNDKAHERAAMSAVLARLLMQGGMTTEEAFPKAVKRFRVRYANMLENYNHQKDPAVWEGELKWFREHYPDYVP
jgi:hypothetical protein